MHIFMFNPVEEKLDGITLDEEFLKNPECPVEHFYTIKKWLHSQKYLPRIQDTKLFQFLFSCFYDIEKTKKCIEVFYTIKTNSPELYMKRDIADIDLRNAMANVSVFVLPVLTPGKRYRIVYLRFESDDTSKFDFIRTVKLCLMAIETSLYIDGTARGHIIVFDLKNVGFKHIMKLNLDTWKIIIRLTQEALPIRKKTMHILHTNYFIYKFSQVLKPFIKPEIFNTIHLHRTNDFDEFYKYVPKECLPSEYGSSLQSIEFYRKNFEEQLWKLRDVFKEDEKHLISK